jgi:DNA polymerase IV
MPTYRKILHLDLDAFFCSVEELRNPALRGKAFAVGGRPEDRGVVASCSYPARMCGVRSAMPMGRALRLCPDLIIVSGRHKLYSEYSEAVMQRVRDLSPLVEQISIDEAFLDVSDLAQPASSIAGELQKAVRTELELPCSLGAAINKLVAKIANDVGKAARKSGQPPNAITVVPAGEEAAFLAPLPVEALWGVGPKTAARLLELGITTIGQLAQRSEIELVHHFGKNGADLGRHARGIDDSPIITTHEAKSISQETTFSKDVRDEKILKRTIFEQSEMVGRRLRQDRLCGATVKLKIRWPDFTTLTRQVSFEIAIEQDQQIYQAAVGLFEKVWKAPQAVRLIGVGVSGLKPPIRQLSFWEGGGDPDHGASKEKEQRLQLAIDQIRQRYGDSILQRGEKSP